MERKIKLIWDFRSIDALEIAENHKKDISNFALKSKIQSYKIGTEEVSEYHCFSFIVVDESKMNTLRDALKPNRAEVAK